ncbi:MAG: glucose 1-dehydrogenase [Rhodospirillaceae bacterium]|jgi:3-oxoacyl-[acyl-carrier protein] reductase|nr:glucose 1-dehydrogenase [Rhodospirillaceae bacterium]MBT3976653.1 glucose 1-dehydrogenase [Rhodospirillaceae bacterium]MBT4171197.1 glucose 1-dehydrogenase [Rhodospirillaceae bacterium]MBT4744297.1 glucose 1-dehydrogenase [Rhodospirillaceae bacterium]MBT5130165.1 glucose 1-dehydrogenase [Rhodospirillaceae bacterium]
MRLRDKVAVVTGAQQGIGMAIAMAFAGEGAAVVINYLDDQAAADKAVGSIVEAGGQATAVAGNVAAPANIERMMAAADAYGGINILVNNAGIFPRVDFLAMTEADWDSVHNINLKAGFFCAQSAARRMIAAGQGGAIINIASVAAYSGPPLGVHYAASKGGVIAMTRALAMALASDDIRVNAIAPGLTDTAQPRDGNSEAEIAATAAKLPLGRIIQPEEIADAAVFLGSNEALQMTGQVMHINGGQMFR